MGLYDREYARGPEPGFHVTAPQTATMQIVLVTAAFYLAQLAFQPLTAAISLQSDWFHRPWTVYQLLTYGFLHDTIDITHILLNMLIFWSFGRELEQRYGKAEFLAFYLTAIVVAGLIWSLTETAFGGAGIVIGASGGVSAVLVLFALLYPHRQVLFMFVIPMPMWIVALIGVAIDVNGAMHRQNSGNVAFMAHLGGAAFGLAYYWFNWRLAPWVSRGSGWLPNRSKPRLRVVEPDDVEEPDELSVKVDAILQKIQEQGQDSLTWSERRLLEKASRQYQQKRK